MVKTGLLDGSIPALIIAASDSVCIEYVFLV